LRPDSSDWYARYRPFGEKSEKVPLNLTSRAGSDTGVIVRRVRGRSTMFGTAAGMRSKPAIHWPSGVIDVGHCAVALVDRRSTVPLPSAACLYTLGTPVRPDSKMICRPSGVQTDIPAPAGSKVRRLSVSCAKSQIQTSVF